MEPRKPGGPFFCLQVRDRNRVAQGAGRQAPPHKCPLCPGAAPPRPPLPKTPPLPLPTCDAHPHAATPALRGSAHPPGRLLPCRLMPRCPDCPPTPAHTTRGPRSSCLDTLPQPAPPLRSPAVAGRPPGPGLSSLTDQGFWPCAPSWPLPPDQVSRGGRPSPPATPGQGEGPESSPLAAGAGFPAGVPRGGRRDRRAGLGPHPRGRCRPWALLLGWGQGPLLPSGPENKVSGAVTTAGVRALGLQVMKNTDPRSGRRIHPDPSRCQVSTHGAQQGQT